ncbi:MAG TPA: UvrD-helicase domain-containing protein [Candidatus Binataceae bacterium]|nr:UvrD-helicase domain-containing protein [Candidatus Binataceae bacterium]
MSNLADQQVRDRIRNDLDTTLVIEAAAGTGKTTALVSRIVAVVASGRAELARVVAVTFTEKAAGELKLRLREEIERARHDDSFERAARERLNRALVQLEEARIGTIHSFCADLLRERPVEAGVDPMFEVAPEDVAGSMFEAAFDRWFEQALASPGDAMRRLLRRRDISEREGPRAIARRAAAEMLEWRDFDAPWTPHPFERDREIDALVAGALALGELGRAADADDWLGRSLDEIARPVAEATRLEPVRGRDYDALEAVLLTLARGRRWEWKGFGGALGGVDRTEVIRRRAELRSRLERFAEEAGANFAPMLREELRPLVGYYDDIKRRAGRLDFLDLLLVARNLVRDNPAVRAELQRRFTRLFVDEFQDTDPLQAEIILLLSSDDPAESDWRHVRPVPGKLFIVGDPKQSIYRFRRADVSLYQSVKRQLVAAGAALEYLTVSFRATPALQEMVNAGFAPLMDAESPTHPAYAPLKPFRPGCETQPPLVVLPVPSPYSDFGRLTDWAIDQSLPNAIAAFARWLVVESGWTVTEREAPGRRVPLQARHICILFRRLNSWGRDVTRPYLRAFEARDLAHVLVKGGSFNQREEVEALRNLLGAIERPDDELMVFAALRGPLLALSDGALLEFRETIGRLRPFAKVPSALPERLAEVARALDLLAELHRGRNRRPIAETIARLLSATRAHAGVAIWPTGEQALANIMRIIEQARRYESRGGATSFRGFVDDLEARAERDEASETPMVEEGSEGVRIMTVHRAKGLEFPVVILADITCRETAGDANRYVDPARRLCALRLAGCAPGELLEHAAEEHRRDQEEAIRLLYVAATRARDLLVIPAVGDGEVEGWVSRLNPVLYPDPASRRAPSTREPAGCPEFGDDSVFERPPRAGGKTKSVAPGLHRPARGEHPVVWWDPSKLRLDVEAAMGLRQRRLLEADESGQISRRGAELYRSWSEQRAATLGAGAAPTIRVAGARELSQRSPDVGLAWAGEVTVEETARDPARPHGERFGTLVHYTMLRVPFHATRAQIEGIAGNVARMIGASGAESDAAADAVEAALKSSLIRAAADSAEVMREYPLLATLDDGTVVEGVADLVFRDTNDGAARWRVVDFKTDVELAPRLDEYRAQLGLYMRALGESTGMTASAAILWI